MYKSKNFTLKIPDSVEYILKKLNDAGFEAFIVGGCVRDALLGRQPNDWDITTSALPADVKKIFRKTFDTGIKHGTITVLLREGQYEVTTYRIDGLYEDSRHPSKVTFTSNLEEDLRRRDFTINAMAYHPGVGIVDPYDGLNDLEAGVIRAVGNPDERFDEDALRIMRAIRFSAQLGFSIDPDTAMAIGKFAPRIDEISRERVRDELLKLITSPYPETFKLLYDFNITKVFFPRFDEMMKMEQNSPSHIYNVGEHTLCVMENIPNEPTLRLAALLHDTGKVTTKYISDGTDFVGESGKVYNYNDGQDRFPDHHIAGAAFAKKWLREMKFDNQTIHDVSTLILYHDFLFPKDEIGVRTVMNLVGDLYPNLMELMKADNAGKSDAQKEKRAPKIALLIELYEKIKARGDCVELGKLKINGSDLISLGFKPGRELGIILNALLKEVIEEPSKNNYEYLSKRAVEINS